MSIFAFENIEEIPNGTHLAFKKLVKKGKCQFDDFCVDVHGNGAYADELDSLFAIMNRKAKGESFAPNRYKALRAANNIYEFKSKHLRIYVKTISPVILVIIGGYKNCQTADINKAVSIINQYEKSL